MRDLVAIVGVVLFLVAIITVFGGSILALGKACQSLISDCLSWPGVALVIGITALVTCLWFARSVISAGSRKRRRG